MPTGAGTNAMGTRIIHWPSGNVETGKQLYSDATVKIEVTDRYGRRSHLDDTTTCDITKHPSEKGDLGIHDGVTRSAAGVVSFDGMRFLGDGDLNYGTVLSCNIDGRIKTAYDTQIRVGWCEPGFAPIARICRPCQDRTFSLRGRFCLDCPTGGNCTSFRRSPEGLPMGVGEPRAQPGYWVYDAPLDGYNARCPKDWLKGQGACSPAEIRKGAAEQCIDREWPAFQVHMCLTGVLFYRCPRGEAACPGNKSMSQVPRGTNYTSGQIDHQCSKGYGHVICGNCHIGYYSAVADTCVKCVGSQEDQVQTKSFYAGLSFMALCILGLFIYVYLQDGIRVGKKRVPAIRNGDGAPSASCCKYCCTKCHGNLTIVLSQGFQIEKFKIALGLCQVFSSFKST